MASPTPLPPELIQTLTGGQLPPWGPSAEAAFQETRRKLNGLQARRDVPQRDLINYLRSQGRFEDVERFAHFLIDHATSVCRLLHPFDASLVAPSKHEDT